MPRDVIMPALGMAQKTGSVVRWRKQPGEAVKAGDVLMEVETDKAVMEVEADLDGVLIDVRAAPGEEIPVGEVIARIADGPVSAADQASGPPAERKHAQPVPAVRPSSSAPPLAAAPAPQPRKNGRIFASPRARRLAAEQRLDLAKLVQAGEPQPYLVRHLAALRALAPDPARRETHPPRRPRLLCG